MKLLKKKIFLKILDYWRIEVQSTFDVKPNGIVSSKKKKTQMVLAKSPQLGEQSRSDIARFDTLIA